MQEGRFRLDIKTNFLIFRSLDQATRRGFGISILESFEEHDSQTLGLGTIHRDDPLGSGVGLYDLLGSLLALFFYDCCGGNGSLKVFRLGLTPQSLMKPMSS